MVVIRLALSGAKKNPFYHIVVADQREPRGGRYIEKIGYYNPVARGKATCLELNQELLQDWIKKGAQPSERVKHLVKSITDASTPVQSSQQKRQELDAKNPPKAAAKKSSPAADKPEEKEAADKPKEAPAAKKPEQAAAAEEKKAAEKKTEKAADQTESSKDDSADKEAS